MHALVRQWEIERDLVQGHSRHARWADMRYIFGHREDEPHAATRARYSIRECGPKTRDRWEREYRCERKITRIMSNSPLCPKTDSKHSTLQIEEKKK